MLFCDGAEVLTIPHEETFKSYKQTQQQQIIMDIMWYVVFSYPWSLAWMFLCLMIGVKGGYLAGLYEPVPEELFWMDRILRRLFDGPPPTTPARRNNTSRNATPRPNNTSRPSRTKNTTKTPPTPPISSESDNDDKTTVVEVAAAPEAEQQEVDLEAQTGSEAEQQLHDDGKN